MADGAAKAAGGFAKRHVFAAILIVAIIAIIFVVLEVRKPGRVSSWIAKIPLLGPRLLGAKTGAAPAGAGTGGAA